MLLEDSSYKVPFPLRPPRSRSQGGVSRSGPALFSRRTQAALQRGKTRRGRFATRLLLAAGRECHNAWLRQAAEYRRFSANLAGNGPDIPPIWSNFLPKFCPLAKQWPKASLSSIKNAANWTGN